MYQRKTWRTLWATTINKDRVSKKRLSTKLEGSGHRGDQGEQSHDTSRLEHDGHEFPWTGESSQGNNPQNQQQERTNTGQSQSSSEVGVGYGRDTGQSQGQQGGEFDDAGQGHPAEQERSPMSSSGLEEESPRFMATDSRPRGGRHGTGRKGRRSVLGETHFCKVKREEAV